MDYINPIISAIIAVIIYDAIRNKTKLSKEVLFEKWHRKIHKLLPFNYNITDKITRLFINIKILK